MKDAISNPDLQEEFHAVMEDIKPRNIKELVEIVHSSESLLTSKNHSLVEMMAEIETNATGLSTLTPIDEESRVQHSMGLPKRGLPLLCRLCATRSNNMIHMFNPTEQYRNIIQKIEYCLPIVVNKTDNLSKEACQLCLAKLELAYQFYQTVVEAEKLLTIREGTWKALKEEPMTDTTTDYDVISDNLNNSGKCRTSSLRNEYQNTDLSSNFSKCRTKETLVTDTTVKKIVVSSNADNVVENRTKSSNDKRRKTDMFSNTLNSSTKKPPIKDTTVKENVILSNANNVNEDKETNSNDKHWKTGSSSNALNSSTKKAPITDTIVEENIISPNLNNAGKNRVRSSNDRGRRTGRSSNSLNCSTDEAPLIDATRKNNTLSSISLYNLNNVGKNRTNSSSNKRRKTNPSSIALNLSKTQFQLKQITSSCPPIQPMHPVHSKEELKTSKETCDTDEYCPPITRSRKASENRNKEDVSRQCEKSSCYISEKQFRPQRQVNSHKAKCERSNDINLRSKKKILRRRQQNYQCSVCGMSCSGKLRLLDHMVNHTNDRPFECPICKKAFNRIRSRNRHVITHTADKPFECELCGLRVRWKHNLKKHRALHKKYAWPIGVKLSSSQPFMQNE